MTNRVTINEIDGRIAEEVFGEPRPPAQRPPLVRPIGNLKAWKPIKHLWNQDDRMYEWRPLVFSSDWELAMRAVDAFLDNEEFGHLEITYDGGERREWAVLVSVERPTPPVTEWYASTAGVPRRDLPKAICLTLLELVDKEKGGEQRD